MNDFSYDSNISQLLRLKFGIIGNSPEMMEVSKKLVQSAPTDLAILITGETGTGKEIFANAIHGLSNRKKSPFVSVNCGAIPETLLESELFGHERGAFTGATDQRKGFFEVAHNGTIFLDEIGEMPIGTQVKLLRVLESGEFTRLGSTNIKRVDVRIVAATNRNIEYEVRDGNFRQDLFFRLNSVRIKLPALREHTIDIHALVEFFGEKVAAKLKIKYEGISAEALNLLKSLPWPGNVRELRNLIETVITLEETSFITPDDLSNHLAKALPPADRSETKRDESLIPYSEYDEPKKFELEIIFRTLLELKSDISDLKRGMHSMAMKLDELSFNQPAYYEKEDSYVQPEEASFDRDEDLNISTMEKNMIQQALLKFEGNRRQAANILGISERTLYRKLSEYDLINK